MRWLILLLAVIIGGFAPHTALSQERPKACTKARSATTTIEVIRAYYPAWSGRCVRVRGIAVGVRLFADRQATLEPHEGYGETVKRSIIVYRWQAPRSYRRPVAVEVMGRVGSCADENDAVQAMQSAQPDQFLMVSGYCHTSLEVYIRPAVVRAVSRAPIPRLLDAEVAPGRRELVDAPVAVAELEKHRAAARALAAAIVDRDMPAFRRLSHPGAQQEIDTLGRQALSDWVRREMREADAQLGNARLQRAFRTITPLSGRQERVFVNHSELPEVMGSDAKPSAFITCWCKTADCAGRWPVAEFDADNDLHRPYVCARTEGYRIWPSHEDVIQASAPIDRFGFSEPDGPRAATGDAP